MKLYPEELEGYKSYRAKQQWESLYLSQEQLAWVDDKSRKFANWTRKNQAAHNFISLTSLTLLTSLVFVNFFYVFPSLKNSWGQLFALCLIQGLLMYSLTNYTIHEGCAHKLIFIGKGRFINFGNFLVRLIPRFFFSDPQYYVSTHISHHKHTGTERDKAYTHFVLPKRFWLSMLPLAGALPFCDYKIHIGTTLTKSGVLSNTLSSLLVLLVLMNSRDSVPLEHAAFFFICLYTFSFFLDRIRETTEHNLMPNNKYGARSFGPSFWGLIFGGLFWGQPCHFIHHLAPNLPWYFQIKLHFEIKQILSKEQKSFYLWDSFVRFPQLLIHVLKTNKKYS